MSFSQAFKLALKSLTGNKMRAFLTMLGIIIGVAAVIILIALVNGMTSSVTSKFESMGTNNISVSITGRGSSRTVDVDDLYDMVDENSDIFACMSPKVTVSGTVKYGSDNYDSTSVTGVSESYETIGLFDVSVGRFLSYSDVTGREKVAVIGTYLAKTCFESPEAAINQYIKINGYQYKVVGVLEEQDDSTEGSTDDCIYIPYTSASEISYGEINSYTFSTVDSDYNTQATNIIEEKLNEVFESDDYYNITDNSEVLESMTEVITLMKTVLVGIAGISLLVGGIGIMNIMLVSVTERTREIGIRKSLGAKRKDIMRQFVIEAGTTSSVGGLIGIVVGIVAAQIAGNLAGVSADVSMFSIILSFGVSVFIGIFFGFLPANKAAKLNPIDALRHD